jgi:hypothetical protein
MAIENVDFPERRPRDEVVIVSYELDRGALPDCHRVNSSSEDEFARRRFPDGYRVELIERGG